MAQDGLTHAFGACFDWPRNSAYVYATCPMNSNDKIDPCFVLSG